MMKDRHRPEIPDTRPKAHRARKAAQEPPLAPDEAAAPDDEMGAIQDLIDVLGRLDTRDMWFARSLVGMWFSRGSLSPKQWFWLHALTAKPRSKQPANLVVLSLTRDHATVAALAEQMRGLDGDGMAAFRAEAQRYYEGHLISLGVPRTWARQDVAALLDTAESQLVADELEDDTA
jgi:hypothetical protein